MPNYRRMYVPGGTYFFTVVTHGRRPILTTDLGRKALHQAIDHVRQLHSFDLVAMVLLPDHCHAVWSLPREDDRYSRRWRRIKEEFTKCWVASGGKESFQSKSRQVKRYRGVWQKRFWEHTVEDEDDLKRCIDYVHWNPRKHQLCDRVQDWKWSSFHRYVREGEYESTWGGVDPVPNWSAPEWGGDF